MKKKNHGNKQENKHEMENNSSQMKADAIEVICQALNVKQEKITDIVVLKKGMTNRSFSFVCNDKKYIMRIPGEGTDKLINRQHEAEVYNIIK